MNEVKVIDPLESVYSMEYIRDNGVVTVYIKEPPEGHFEVGSIAILTIEVVTPCDPEGKCTARMDIDVVNHYKIGHFDSPQEIQWNVGIRELRVLKAFPWLHDILISGSEDSVSIPDFICSFVEKGGLQSDCFRENYEKLKSEFDMSSQPTFEEYSRPN